MMERSVNVAESEYITPDDLPAGFSRAVERSRSGSRGYVRRRSGDTYDRDLVVSLLEKYGDNKTKVCEELGISRPTLYRKLKSGGSTTGTDPAVTMYQKCKHPCNITVVLFQHFCIVNKNSNISLDFSSAMY